MNKILEYQKLDSECFKLEQQMAKSAPKKKISDSVQFANESKDKLMNLDNEAGKSYKEYNDLVNVLNDNVKNVELLLKQDLDGIEEGKLKNLQDKIALVQKNLIILEKRNFAIQSKMQKQLQEFDSTKSQVAKAKEQHQKSKADFDELKKSVEPEMEKIKKQLAKLQKDIDPALLEKYQKARKDNIFPVFVGLNDKRCGGCRMELPVATLDKLKAKKMLECEQCRRIIYVD